MSSAPRRASQRRHERLAVAFLHCSVFRLGSLVLFSPYLHMLDTGFFKAIRMSAVASCKPRTPGSFTTRWSVIKHATPTLGVNAGVLGAESSGVASVNAQSALPSSVTRDSRAALMGIILCRCTAKPTAPATPGRQCRRGAALRSSAAAAPIASPAVPRPVA